MVNPISIHLREELPPHIVKGANLNAIMSALLDTFLAGEQKNAELVNKFFEQVYFRGEASLIDKFTEVQPNIEFDDIKDEGINLALLLDDSWRSDFKLCLDNLGNDNIKKAIIQLIFNKIQSEIGSSAPYDDFSTECAIPGDTNVIGYFQTVLDYLTRPESITNGKRVVDVLKTLVITNQDLNSSLPTGEQIPSGIALKDSSIPQNVKKDFDRLLSFEIGKEADRMINISKDISNKLNSLYTNSLPAINTIIGEYEEYKYDESKLGAEYQQKLQELNHSSLDGPSMDKEINRLRWGYYLQYLKTKNKKIGDALEQLYNNNFDYSKLDNSVLKGYLERVADIRLKMLFDSEVNEIIKINAGNKDEFADFYRKLADPSEANIQLRPGITLPVEKKIVEGENQRLNDINQFGKDAQPFDALPITYRIKKSDIEALPFDLEDRIKLLNFLNVDRYNTDDKSYTIEGREVGNLIFLFFVVNRRTPLTTFDSDKQEDLQRLFGEAKPREQNGGSDNDSKAIDVDEDVEDVEEENTIGENITSDNNPIQAEGGTEIFTPEKFKEEVEKLGPGKFENGSEIWIPYGPSKLPGGGYQWMKIKISDIDIKKGVFRGTISGGEFEFKTIEGKTIKFDMNKKTLDKFGEASREVSGNSDKVYLLPDPSKKDFNSFKDSLDGKLGSFPVDGVTWDGSKFIQKIIDKNGKEKEVEVKYFGSSADDKSTYKIDYNPRHHCFAVSPSFIGETKGKDGKTKTERLSYTRYMDWNNFLIFFSQKGLYPQTEKESESALMRQDEEFKVVNGGHRKLNWFSINNIKHGFKDIFGTLKKGIDNYNKQKDERFRKSVEERYLKAMGALPFLPASLKSAIGERQQEIYNEEFNGAWTEIEKYLKALQSDGQFADTFEQVPPHVQTLYGTSYQKFIKNLYLKKNASTEERRKAAALLLANFEKGGSPFRGLTEYENKGLWVKILLGEAHYQQFLRDKAACIRDRDLAEKSKESGLDKKGLNEQLATCEMDYIINNVRGAYPKLPGSYFPSHENRGINGNKSTNYIPNPSKRLLSEQFANKLEDAKKGRFTKSSVEEAYSKNKTINRFEVMEDDFGKMSSSRYKQGAGALRRMLDLAADESLKKRAKRHFLTFLLSGALDVNCDPGLKKQIYGWAKPMSFVPGMLVKEAGVAENIAILLDEATKGDFSRNVTKYFHRNKQLKGEIDFKGLQTEIKNWLTDEQMDKLDEYFTKLPTEDFSGYPEPQKNILEKFKASLIEEDVEEFDRGLLDNPTIVNNGLLTNVNVVSDRLRVKDGEFEGKDSDDISNKKKFWKDITKQLNNLKTNSNDPKIVNFVLNKYFAWFGLNSTQDRQKAYQWIKTAYRWKDKIGKPFKYDYNGKGQLLDMGMVSKKEIDDVIWYTFQGTVMKDCFSARKLPSELTAALEAFQHFFEKAFEEGRLNDTIVKKDSFKSNEDDIKIEPLLLGSSSLYKDVFSGDADNMYDDTVISEDKDAFKNDKQRRKAQKRAFQSGRFINYELAQIEKSFKNRLPKTSYRVITQDTTSDIETRIKWLNEDDKSDAA